MFNLIYRDGAPENAGHYEGFQKDAKATVMSVGELVSVTNGVASKYDASGKPYGVVARASGKDEEDVAVLRITDDMIFRITTTGTTGVSKGDKKKVTISGITTGAATGVAFEITDVVSKTMLDGRFVDVE